MAQIEERNRTSAALPHLHAQPTRPPTQAAPRTATPRPRAPSIWARNNIFPIAAERNRKARKHANAPSHAKENARCFEAVGHLQQLSDVRLFGDSAYGALVDARTAIDAGIGVHRANICNGKSLLRASVNANAACYAIISINGNCHFWILSLGLQRSLLASLTRSVYTNKRCPHQAGTKTLRLYRYGEAFVTLRKEREGRKEREPRRPHLRCHAASRETATRTTPSPLLSHHAKP